MQLCWYCVRYPAQSFQDETSMIAVQPQWFQNFWKIPWDCYRKCTYTCTSLMKCLVSWTWLYNTLQGVPRPSQRKVYGRIGCLQVAVLSWSQALPTTTPTTITSITDATLTTVTILRTTMHLVKLAVPDLVVVIVTMVQTLPCRWGRQRTGHRVLWIITTQGDKRSWCPLFVYAITLPIIFVKSA